MSIISFLKSESGGVTVDWVVLTAGLVGVGMVTVMVVTGGVEDLSAETMDALVETEVGVTFDNAAVLAMDWGAYEPLAGQHGAAWGDAGFDAQGRTWAENTYDGWSTLDDAQLTATYNQHYAYATTNPTNLMETQTRADYVAVSEQIMRERGLDVPQGNMTAAELRATF